MPKFFAVLPGRTDGERPDALPEALEEAFDGHDAELDTVKAVGGTITKGGEGTDPLLWVGIHYVCHWFREAAMSQNLDFPKDFQGFWGTM